MPIQPTSPSERYRILDILRGFALLGVLIANMNTHSGYFFLSESSREALPMSQADGAIAWTLHFLVEGKFYSLFALLFGIGFALQLNKWKEGGLNFSGFFRRRLFILFIMGLLHAVLFYVGDILTVYAITGIFLLLFRKASNKVLLRASFVFMLLPLIQYAIIWALNMNTGSENNAEAVAAQQAFFDQLILSYQHGSFFEIVQNEMGGLVFGRYPDLIFTGRFFRVLAMFLLGYYATRKMIYARLEENRSLLKKIMVWGAIIGFPCNFVLAMMMETGAYYNLEPLGIVQPLVYAFGVPALSLFYAAGVGLLFSKRRNNRVLNWFLPVGKMALTNYLMQSVICCFIFMGYGLGWFASVSRFWQMGIGLSIFIFQMIFSHVWLQRFRFGPMEWLWRSATYRQWQKMDI